MREHVEQRVEVRRVLALAAGVALALAGCAARQVVPLSLEPAPVELYVDGERVPADGHDAVELRVDRGHVILVKRVGYRPAQVVIESVERGGRRVLDPERVAVRLEPLRDTGRRIEVELDDQ